MRSWLWGTLLNNVGMYESNLIYVHAIVSVLVIFIVASIIDIIRAKTIENPFLNLVEKAWDKLTNKFKRKEADKETD